MTWPETQRRPRPAPAAAQLPGEPTALQPSFIVPIPIAARGHADDFFEDAIE